MFCKKCGKEVNEDAFVCIHCGCLLDESYVKNKKNEIVDDENEVDENDKTGIGAVMGIFLSFIGLIIGISLYTAESKKRETFIKGWAVGFVVSFIIGLIIGLTSM